MEVTPFYFQTHPHKSTSSLPSTTTAIVDFRKGCYLGQELTIRTYHTGVIRKRILPLQLFHSYNEALETTEFSINPSENFVPLPESQSDVHEASIEPDSLTIKTKRTGLPGKFCQGWGNVGLALVRLEYGTPLLKSDQLQQPGSILQLENGIFARAFAINR